MHFISTCNVVQYMDYRMNTIMVGEFSFLWNYWNWNHYITMIDSLSWRPHFCILKAATDSATGLKSVAMTLPQLPKIFSTKAECSGGPKKIEIRGFKEVVQIDGLPKIENLGQHPRMKHSFIFLTMSISKNVGFSILQSHA